MEWPSEVSRLFLAAFTESEAAPGYTKEDAVQYLLDESARMAVERCGRDPKSLKAAYQTPYTPIGELTASGFGGRLNKVVFSPTYAGGTWEPWSQAIDKLYEFIDASNAEAIIAKFGRLV